MTAELVERLRAGLEGTAPGPWIAEQLSSVRDKTIDRLYVAGPSEVVCGNDGICEPAGYNDRTFAEDAANMRHIANCSPDNIRILLDTIDGLRARLAEETAIVDRIWRVLGISTYDQAEAKSIYEIVASSKSRATSAEETVRELTRALEYEPTDADLEAAWVHGNIRCYALRPFLAEIRRRARATERRDA